MIKLVTFDCYGTLVDWVYGVGSFLKHVLGRDVWEPFLKLDLEEVKSGGFKPYSKILKSSLRRLMELNNMNYEEAYGEALTLAFAKSPPFPDTVVGLIKLKKLGYNLGIVSNTERELIKITLSGLEDLFNHIVTAEDTGYYKPKVEAFTSTLKLLNLKTEEVVHVSSYPQYDLEPAESLGIRTILLDRYGYHWKLKVKNIDKLPELLIN